MKRFRFHGTALLSLRDTTPVRIVCIIFALVFAGASFAEDPGIAHIRKEYLSIRNALPRLKAETVELSEYSTEGGEARAFHDSKGNVRLVKVELFFESGKEFEEFYYENGALIFALYTQHRYNVPFYVTPETAKEIGGEAFDPKKTTITEDRYYFNHGKMIQWLAENKNRVKPQSKEFKNAEKEIIETSNEMLLRFRKNNRTTG
jgi:hypothetical protein